MAQIDGVVAKLKMIGKEPLVLSKRAIRIDDQSDYILIYVVDDKGKKISEHRYTDLINVSEQNTYFGVQENDQYCLVDSTFKVKMKLFGEKPIKLYKQLYLELENTKYNTVRLTGLDGTLLSKTNAKALKKWDLSGNKILVVTQSLWEEPTIDVIGYSDKGYTIEGIGIKLIDLDDSTIDIGEDSILVASKRKDKLYEYSFSGKLKLSIPHGTLSRNSKNVILIKDRFGKVMKQIRGLNKL